jgi:hypothetical protein
MINEKDYYYLICVIVNIIILYTLNVKKTLNTNKYIDFLFYILIIILNEFDIKFSIMISFLYIILKIREIKLNT